MVGAGNGGALDRSVKRGRKRGQRLHELLLERLLVQDQGNVHEVRVEAQGSIRNEAVKAGKAWQMLRTHKNHPHPAPASTTSRWPVGFHASLTHFAYLGQGFVHFGQPGAFRGLQQVQQRSALRCSTPHHQTGAMTRRKSKGEKRGWGGGKCGGSPSPAPCPKPWLPLPLQLAPGAKAVAEVSSTVNR